jgi:hypothetical protein
MFPLSLSLLLLLLLLSQPRGTGVTQGLMVNMVRKARRG